MALLRMSGVDAWYGSAQVLFGVDLQVGEGEMVGLLGRNGAGKSTTFKSVMGVEAKRTGDIQLAGRDVSRALPEQVARAGVAWVPPDRRIFADLSVRDNLRLAASARGVPLDVDRIVEVLPLLERLIDRQGYQLSGGEQQAVALARALAARPTVLLLDEPTEGLAPLVVQQLAESIGTLASRLGVSVLLAEQNLQFILRLTSRVYVLESGRVVYEGSSVDFGNAPDLQHRYLSVASGRQQDLAADPLRTTGDPGDGTH